MRKEVNEFHEHGAGGDDATERMPLWETIIMVASFGLLWAWFLARQNSLRSAVTTPESAMSPLWQIVLVGSLLALVVIMVRRLKRVKRALEENDPRRAGMHGYPPGMPFGFTQPHGTSQTPKRKKDKS
ncbi:MAG: hypothetical protein JWN98_611 [Abditibacteriota bacterium]|nr:hypothetical protein [Abditibacteriota bacterium]